LGVFLEDFEVVEESLFNWEVVGMVCEGEESTVFLFKGVSGGEGLGSGGRCSSVQSASDQGFRVASRCEESHHAVCLRHEVVFIAAQSSQSEELAEGYAVFGGVGVTGGV
jgi:hypothetical protein